MSDFVGPPPNLPTQIFVKYQAMKKAKDVILLEGATVRGLLGNHNELNAKIAAELDASILMVGWARIPGRDAGKEWSAQSVCGPDSRS